MQTLNERLERRVKAIEDVLPDGKSKTYYEGMLFGYRQAVIGIFSNIDHFANESETWDITTLTAVAIERKMKESK